MNSCQEALVLSAFVYSGAFMNFFCKKSVLPKDGFPGIQKETMILDDWIDWNGKSPLERGGREADGVCNPL